VPGAAEPFRLRQDDEQPVSKPEPGSIRSASSPTGRSQTQAFRLKPVDDELPPKAATEEPSESAVSTYSLGSAFVPAVHPANRAPAIDKPGPKSRSAEPVDKGPIADGLLPVLERTESNWFASFLYPLRSAECLGVIAILSGVCWVFVNLVPEYCLTIMGDASSMGAPTMGKFIALISILPVILLTPFALFYWLQYLGRVLVCSAMGDTTPPRTPDRNFDGFFNGLSPWLVWLAMGVSVAMLPLVAYGIYEPNSAGVGNGLVNVALFALGFPYAVMALLMCFLHDNAVAANPLNVAIAAVRLGFSFLLLCAFVLGVIGLVPAACALLLHLRAGHFWIYLTLCLPGWAVIGWCSIVIMWVMGNYYYERRDLLAWHHERPRWGVVWKL
jgi:hypothetical protein